MFMPVVFCNIFFFFYMSNANLLELIGKYSFPFSFLKDFVYPWYYFFLKRFVKIY